MFLFYNFNDFCELKIGLFFTTLFILKYGSTITFEDKNGGSFLVVNRWANGFRRIHLWQMPSEFSR